jgi:hypothetical protein
MFESSLIHTYHQTGTDRLWPGIYKGSLFSKTGFGQVVRLVTAKKESRYWKASPSMYHDSKNP